MSKRKFEKGELILVDVAALTTHEKWVPGVYVEFIAKGRHKVEIMEDGGRVLRAYSDACIKHSDEALDLRIHFEVYADRYGSNCFSYEWLDEAKKQAEAMIDGGAMPDGKPSKHTVIIDKVFVGGYNRFAVYEPKGNGDVK